MIDLIRQWQSQVRVLDGGFGSECERLSEIPIKGHTAWSCRLLKDDPNLVCEIHKSFIRAGSDVIGTNTYQASPQTLSESLNVSKAEGEEYMRHAVRLARRAIDAVDREQSIKTTERLPVLVAGCLGPYGACLADGSEYSGSYADSLDFTELVDFHYERAKLLSEASVDFIAWETMPSLKEVSAICEVMHRLTTIPCWITVASTDGQTTVGGDPLFKIALEVQEIEQVFAIGVNCCIPHDLIGQAFANLRANLDTCQPGTDDNSHPPSCSNNPKRKARVEASQQKQAKMLIVYANSGELWLPTKRRRQSSNSGRWIWPPDTGPSQWLDRMKPWVKRRVNEELGEYSIKPLAQWAGGCCRVRPGQIEQLSRWMKADEGESAVHQGIIDQDVGGGGHSSVKEVSKTSATMSGNRYVSKNHKRPASDSRQIVTRSRVKRYK